MPRPDTTTELVRSQFRLSRDVHNVLLGMAHKLNKSLNTIIELACIEYIKNAALEGKLEMSEIPQSLDAQDESAANYLARIERAQDAVKELRWLAGSGAIPTYEEFTLLRKSISPQVRNALIEDVRANGPLIYHGPDDPDRILSGEPEAVAPVARSESTSTLAEPTAAESAMLEDLEALKDIGGNEDETT